MAFQLKKGGSFELSKGIQNILVGLGWNPSAKAGEAFDLDAHAFGLVHPGGDPNKATFWDDGTKKFPLALSYANFNPGGACLNAPEVNPKAFKTPGGEMIHLGDERTGASAGDDESIQIALARLPKEVNEVAFWVTIHEAAKRQQTFGQVKDAYIHIIDKDSNSELCRYNLNEQFVTEQSVQVGSMVRKADGSWQFVAVGSGAKVELGDILDKYCG